MNNFFRIRVTSLALSDFTGPRSFKVVSVVRFAKDVDYISHLFDRAADTVAKKSKNQNSLCTIWRFAIHRLKNCRAKYCAPIISVKHTSRRQTIPPN